METYPKKVLALLKRYHVQEASEVEVEEQLDICGTNEKLGEALINGLYYLNQHRPEKRPLMLALLKANEQYQGYLADIDDDKEPWLGVAIGEDCDTLLLVLLGLPHNITYSE